MFPKSWYWLDGTWPVIIKLTIWKLTGWFWASLSLKAQPIPLDCCCGEKLEPWAAEQRQEYKPRNQWINNLWQVHPWLLSVLVSCSASVVYDWMNSMLSTSQLEKPPIILYPYLRRQKQGIPRKRCKASLCVWWTLAVVGRSVCKHRVATLSTEWSQ